VDRLDTDSTAVAAFVIQVLVRIFSLMVSCFDAFTAFKFSRYITQQKSFQSGADYRTTDIIAKFGLCIALTSLLSSCFMFADSRTGTVITIVLSCISASLWMGMKLTLEKAEGKREEHVQNSANSKVSQMQKLSEVITDNS
jgi:hypothetical protein